MTPRQMQMAKASQADLDAAMELHQILDGVAEWPHERPSDLGIEGYDDCETPLDAILRAFRKGGLLRVVWGMAVVCDPQNELLDPDSAVVAKHPKILKAFKAESELRGVMEAVDKWLDDPADLAENPATRAARAREIALRAIEAGGAGPGLILEERQFDDDAFAVVEADEAWRSMAIVAFLVLAFGGALVGIACWAWWRWA